MGAGLGEGGVLGVFARPISSFVKGEPLLLLAVGAGNAGVRRAEAGHQGAAVMAGDLLQAVIPVIVVLGGGG